MRCKLTVLCSLGVAAINVVIGTAIAWVLVRDEFPGKRLINSMIDLPFALPTIVAGLTLLALYGQRQPDRHHRRLHRRRRDDGVAVRHPALRRPRGPADPDRARPGHGGGGGLARGQPLDHLPADRAAEPAARDPRRRRPRLRPGDRRVRFADPALAATSPARPRWPRSSSSAQIESGNTTGAAAVSVVLLAVSLAVLLALGARRSPRGDHLDGRWNDADRRAGQGRQAAEDRRWFEVGQVGPPLRRPLLPLGVAADPGCDDLLPHVRGRLHPVRSRR